MGAAVLHKDDFGGSGATLGIVKHVDSPPHLTAKASQFYIDDLEALCAVLADKDTRQVQVEVEGWQLDELAELDLLRTKLPSGKSFTVTSREILVDPPFGVHPTILFVFASPLFVQITSLDSGRTVLLLASRVQDFLNQHADKHKLEADQSVFVAKRRSAVPEAIPTAVPAPALPPPEQPVAKKRFFERNWEAVEKAIINEGVKLAYFGALTLFVGVGSFLLGLRQAKVPSAPANPVASVRTTAPSP